MPTVKIDHIKELDILYRTSGHPLGKNRRGRKKWTKRMIIKALTNFVKENS